MSKKTKKGKPMKTINLAQRTRAFLYQWTNFDTDFNAPDKLGRLGGSVAAANKFRGIESDLKKFPNSPCWVICARCKDGIWLISALLKVRLPTLDEKNRIGSPGDLDKYLYFDEEESGFLACPNDSPVNNNEINNALNATIGKFKRGTNGTEFEVSEDTINILKRAIKLKLSDRRKQLSSGRTTNVDPVDADDQKPEPEAAPPNIEDIRPMPEMVSPSIPTIEQGQLQQDTSELATSEREAVVKVRYGQGKFREALITIDGAKCWMSGIEGRQLLIASHIKPWSACDDDTGSRGKCDNGLLLSSLWDAAFDSGLITIGEDWQVIPSAELSESAKGALKINENNLLPERYRNSVRGEYLAYHRNNVFERWKKPAASPSRST